MPPADPAVRLLLGAVVELEVVFLCLRLLPEVGALPAPRGAADFEPTLVFDAGAG